MMRIYREVPEQDAEQDAEQDGLIADRRSCRRHDMDSQEIAIQRVDARTNDVCEFGRLVDMSAVGVRIRTKLSNIRPDQQIRVQVQLPSYAGISPFIELCGNTARPRSTWTGWLSIARVTRVGIDEFEVGGRLVDLEDLDRGMLALYLSTQPLAA
jgi:hypothetical protein